MAEDVDLTVNLVEKIITNISPENVKKAPEVKKCFSKDLSCIAKQLFIHLIRDPSFSTYAKLSEKLTFLTRE